MDYILSLSYGKDSLACLGAIEKLGWPLDRIVHAEVWATDTIPADLPPMVDFKAKADAIIKQRWGISVEHFRSSKTFESVFYRKRTHSRNGMNGAIYGWPGLKSNWCNSELKMEAIRAARRIYQPCTSYVGIAADEQIRLARLSTREKSPLNEIGWSESDCREWCKRNDLLSPIYTTVTRGGCWFCHNQRIDQLRLLRKNYPEYLALMLKWDSDRPQTTFFVGGKTIHDFDRRFQLEDDGFLLPEDRNFRWDMLDQELNLRLF